MHIRPITPDRPAHARPSSVQRLPFLLRNPQPSHLPVDNPCQPRTDRFPIPRARLPSTPRPPLLPLSAPPDSVPSPFPIRPEPGVPPFGPCEPCPSRQRDEPQRKRSAPGVVRLSEQQPSIYTYLFTSTRSPPTPAPTPSIVRPPDVRPEQRLSDTSASLPRLCEPERKRVRPLRARGHPLDPGGHRTRVCGSGSTAGGSVDGRNRRVWEWEVPDAVGKEGVCRSSVGIDQRPFSFLLFFFSFPCSVFFFNLKLQLEFILSLWRQMDPSFVDSLYTKYLAASVSSGRSEGGAGLRGHRGVGGVGADVG